MTITAKFDGKCKRCGVKILAGQQIEWTKENGAQHIDCCAVNPEWAAYVARCKSAGVPVSSVADVEARNKARENSSSSLGRQYRREENKIARGIYGEQAKHDLD